MRLSASSGKRKVTWLAFGLIVLAAITSHAQETTSHDSLSTNSDEPPPHTSDHDPSPSNDDVDHAAEASRAYKQAVYTLSALTAHPPSHTFDTSFISGYHPNSQKSIFSSLIPTLQGRGPIGSAVRIVLRLQHRLANTLSSIGSDTFGMKRTFEDSYRKAIKVLDLLQHSADLGNMDALYTLAQISLFPPTDHFPSDPRLAYDAFATHASLTGNASSQAVLAFFHATGYRDVVPLDQARAQLYYTFAANGGHRGAQMALGYRYWSGIGTLENCERAVDWYEQASEQAMAKFLSGPPGGRTLPQTPTKLSDLVGGVYGPGASVASTGLNANRAAIKAGLSRESGETWADILDFYLFNANRGETGFAYRLGKIYYQGSIYAAPGGIASGSEGVGAVPQDYEIARHYFLQIARQVWPRDPPNPLQYQPQPPIKDENLPIGYAAASAGYLGRMYLRGEGLKADPAMAKMWFERGVEYGERECHNGLGTIYRDGLITGGKPDMKKAMHHFAAAAGQELAEAQVNIAKIHFARGEYPVAAAYFDTAVRLGSPFEAYYYLGQIHSAQASTPNLPANVAAGSCAMAVQFHKLVAERGSWDDDFPRDAELAWVYGTERSQELAMLKWWIAAERGSEVAQSNMAYILDQDKSLLRLTRFSPITPSNDTAHLALTQWTRAAAQRNIDALVKVGDYYYHGLGVPDEPEPVRYEKAARYYQSAADTQMSALAMWNLGWMYENGIGVPQDFHLAKRHYDSALETNPESYLPVLLSLAKLYFRSFWYTVQGGQGGLSIWNLDDDEEPILPTQHAQRPEEIDDGRQWQTEPPAEHAQDHERYYDDDGAPWYLGKARDEFRRRRNGPQDIPDGEEDPIQWARQQRQAEQERDSDFGPEDYFEGAMRGGHRGEDDANEFSETMILILLCLTVSVLIYVRTRIVDRMRRDRQEQARQQGDPPAHPEPPVRGLFPPPGDERNNWAILR